MVDLLSHPFVCKYVKKYVTKKFRFGPVTESERVCFEANQMLLNF